MTRSGVDTAGLVRAAFRHHGLTAVDGLLAELSHQELRDLIRHLIGILSAGEPCPTHAKASSAAICQAAVSAAALATGTSPEEILGPGRSQPVADARAVAMTAARDTGLTLSVIGSHLGRDHTSVLHAVRRTRRDPRLRGLADHITKRLLPALSPPQESRPADPKQPHRCSFPGCGRPTTGGGDAGVRTDVCGEHDRVRVSGVGSWVDDHHQQGGHG